MRYAVWTSGDKRFKPLGWSSNDALQKAKWLLRAEKAGHTGTLDPLATGVLPLCCGAATKFSQLHLDADKRYAAVARLGVTTSTGDREGEVLRTRPVQVTAEDVERACAALRGPIRQVPPMYSALKKDGRALYEYAREGVTVERAARDGAEIGGHPLSGHIDFKARVHSIRRPDNNCVLRFAVPAPWMRYVFAKGYIAVNGASLTVAEANRAERWFEVWLIPETLRMTTFGAKHEGDSLNLEIERATQVVVDTVRDALDERLALRRHHARRARELRAHRVLPDGYCRMLNPRKSNPASPSCFSRV